MSPTALQAAAHLRRILTKYSAYYNELRTHRFLDKDAPIHGAIQRVGRVVSAPVLGGLLAESNFGIDTGLRSWGGTGQPTRRGQASNPRSLRNFRMQANGAEMRRIACCLATERGIEVCCSVHDAVLITAPLDRLEDDVTSMRAAMAEASRLVLDGFELGTDAESAAASCGSG